LELSSFSTVEIIPNPQMPGIIDFLTSSGAITFSIVTPVVPQEPKTWLRFRPIIPTNKAFGMGVPERSRTHTTNVRIGTRFEEKFSNLEVSSEHSPMQRGHAALIDSARIVA
jgi:hypothetical protein